ncbi:MAG TPA: hypothetical protein VGI81_28435 [Tepidisphaeraceae bacterium]
MVVSAGEVDWNALSGNWSVGANWVGGIGPNNNDRVVLKFAGNATSTDDIINPPGQGGGGGLTLQSLYVSQTGTTGTNGFYQAAPLTVANTFIGEASLGSYEQATGTTAVHTTCLYVGYHSFAGSYQLDGSATVASPTELVGFLGSGTFTQGSAGTDTSWNQVQDLQLGVYSDGTYTMAAGLGTLFANKIELGTFDQGSGTFDHRAGDVVVTAANGLDGSVYVGAGQTAATSNLYEMKGGNLAAVNLVVGSNVRGDFQHTGGAVTLTGDLELGLNAPGPAFNGTYELSNSASLSALNEYIGYANNGLFTQSDSSTNTISGNLVLAQNAIPGTLSAPTYTLNGGTLHAGSESIGVASAAHFIQNGGTNTVTGNLTIYPVGTYALHGGGTLNVQGDETITGGGTRFTQDGGSHTVAGTATLGANDSAAFSLSGGNFTAGDLTINGGQFGQFGGVVGVGGSLSISGGQYNLTAGTLQASLVALVQNMNLATLHVGNSATAHLVVLQGDGTMQVDAGGQALFDTPGGQNAIGAVVQNAGTVALVAGSDIQLSGTVNNNSGGTVDLQTDAGFNGYGTFNNNSGAMFQKSGGSGTSAVSGVALTNAGTIDARTGIMDLNVTGTNAGAIASEGGARVLLGGTWTLNDGTVFSGSGITNLYGTATLMADARATTQFQVAPGGSLQGSGYTFTSAYSLELQDGSSASSPSSTSPLTIASQGSGMTLTGYVSLNGVVLNAQSSTSQLSGASGSGSLSCGSNTTINNRGDWYVFDGTGITGNASSSAFNNTGTFTNYTSTGTTAVTIPFNNSGTVTDDRRVHGPEPVATAISRRVIVHLHRSYLHDWASSSSDSRSAVNWLV